MEGMKRGAIGGDVGTRDVLLGFSPSLADAVQYEQ